MTESEMSAESILSTLLLLDDGDEVMKSKKQMATLYVDYASNVIMSDHYRNLMSRDIIETNGRGRGFSVLDMTYRFLCILAKSHVILPFTKIHFPHASDNTDAVYFMLGTVIRTGDRIERYKRVITAYIRDRGKCGARLCDLSSITQGLKSNERLDVLYDLEASGFIKRAKIVTTGRPATLYFYNYDGESK